jgi:hypothetical protein
MFQQVLLAEDWGTSKIGEIRMEGVCNVGCPKEHARWPAIPIVNGRLSHSKDVKKAMLLTPQNK